MQTQTWASALYAEHYNSTYEFTPDQVDAFLAPHRLHSEDVYVDFGCGDGRAVVRAAEVVRAAVGVDVSAHQLELARERLKTASLFNEKNPRSSYPIFLQSSFLDFQLPDLKISKASARKSFHHLTEDEKESFWFRFNSASQLGALFLLEDAIFDFRSEDLDREWNRVMTDAKFFYGERWSQIRQDFESTLRDEFPTDEERLHRGLEQAGFEIVAIDRRTCFYAAALARKVREAAP